MIQRLLFLLLATALLAGCGGKTAGRVKGRVVENGQPIKIVGQAALMFYRIDESGKPNESQSYPIPLSNDGTFELVASGGELPPGTYLVSLMVFGTDSTEGIGKYRDSFPYPGSTLRQEVKAGMNDVTIDLGATQS